jgi:hypothetical protein
MAGAALNFGDLKAAVSVRIEALAAWARSIPVRLRAADSRVVAKNVAFGIALVAGLAIIAYAALRSTAVPGGPSSGTVKQTIGSTIAAAHGDPLPVVEPVILMPTDADSARKINAAVPFSTASNPAAAPFASLETGDDLQRSVDCLATAVLYEAGDDAAGERAVAQVVLNRVRHPAFPNSVCAVVFQGSERSTGCQFSFTCDGSLLRRTPRPDAWARAQEVGRQALSGAVFPTVGTATHYHTDWVVPYWSSSMDKITAVKTHLFFRWKGFWGTPPAFRQVAADQAPIIPAMASLSDVHKTPEALAALRMTQALETMAIHREGNIFLLGWNDKTSLEILPQLAANLCGADPECRVVGWPGGEKALPEAGNHAALMRASFLYEPGIGAAAARALWNCKALKRPGAACLTPRDLAAVKVMPPVALADLVPREPPLASLDALPTAASSPAELVPAANPSGTASAGNSEPAIVMPTRKHRDPCAAMRGVAEADRIGPCSQHGS